MRGSIAAVIIIIAVLVSGVAGYAVATSQIAPTTRYSVSTYFTVRTITVHTNTTSTSTCTFTGGIGCPHFFNQTYVLSVDYGGPWGLSYQGYLGTGTGGTLAEAGNFFGHGPANESITVSGTDTSGITACVEAQKLDGSSSVLTLRLLTGNAVNQTSLPYGIAKICMAYAIV
ncbi:MAG: hypothetical protein JRN15_13480 [Nitrososphaerota archaeon]|nr:hypothetical protein [Nitrososphaerota archaeon]